MVDIGVIVTSIVLMLIASVTSLVVYIYHREIRHLRDRLERLEAWQLEVMPEVDQQLNGLAERLERQESE